MGGEDDAEQNVHQMTPYKVFLLQNKQKMNIKKILFAIVKE